MGIMAGASVCVLAVRLSLCTVCVEADMVEGMAIPNICMMLRRMELDSDPSTSTLRADLWSLSSSLQGGMKIHCYVRKSTGL